MISTSPVSASIEHILQSARPNDKVGVRIETKPGKVGDLLDCLGGMGISPGREAVHHNQGYVTAALTPPQIYRLGGMPYVASIEPLAD